MLSNPAGRLHDFSRSPLLQQGAQERGVGEKWPTFALMTAEMLVKPDAHVCQHDLRLIQRAS